MSRSYSQLVDAFILEQSDKCSDFKSLIKELPGIFPTQVLERLKILSRENQISDRNLQKFTDGILQIPKPKKLSNKKKEILPLPHPLDYEWRYTSLTRDYLIKKLSNSCQGNKSIVLIGAPTVFIDLVKRNIDSNLFLLDYNQEMLRVISDQISSKGLLMYDVFDYSPPKLEASVILLDPPWYDAYFRSFLWTSSECSLLGSEIILSFPSIGTRPNVKKERDNIINFAASVGLEFCSIEEKSISYKTPFFEFNALRAAGLYNFPLDWRNGDLLIFKKKKPVQSIPSIYSNRPSVNSWIEIRYGDLRFRIKEENNNLHSPEINPILDTEILPSVSSRFKAREKANFWTIGNRIYECNCSSLIINSLRNLNKESSNKSSNYEYGNNNYSKTDIDVIENKLKQIITKESKELTEYLSLS